MLINQVLVNADQPSLLSAINNVDVLSFVAKIVSTPRLGLKSLTSKEPKNYLVLIFLLEFYINC